MDKETFEKAGRDLEICRAFLEGVALGDPSSGVVERCRQIVEGAQQALSAAHSLAEEREQGKLRHTCVRELCVVYGLAGATGECRRCGERWTDGEDAPGRCAVRMGKEHGR